MLVNAISTDNAKTGESFMTSRSITLTPVYVHNF